MKKLLATLGLFFLLMSPALAGHYTLEHGKSYTSSMMSCASRTDAMGFIHAINQTQQHTMAIIIDNNCVPRSQRFTYINEEYVCSFSVQDRNYTLLNTEVEGIKQFIIVQSLANNMFEPCLEVKEMEKTIQ